MRPWDNETMMRRCDDETTPKRTADAAQENERTWSPLAKTTRVHVDVQLRRRWDDETRRRGDGETMSETMNEVPREKGAALA